MNTLDKIAALRENILLPAYAAGDRSLIADLLKILQDQQRQIDELHRNSLDHGLSISSLQMRVPKVKIETTKPVCGTCGGSGAIIDRTADCEATAFCPDCQPEQQEGWSISKQSIVDTITYDGEIISDTQIIDLLTLAGITPTTSDAELAAMARLGKMRARGLEFLQPGAVAYAHDMHQWITELLLGEGNE